jgi:hypothetical protein
MLYASIVIDHTNLDMTNDNAERLSAEMIKEFGEDDRAAVTTSSQLFGPGAPVWQQRICYGSFHQGYSLLVWRQKSDELQAHIELTGDLPFHRACESAHRGTLKALSSTLDTTFRLGPRLRSLEIVPIGENRPILSGKTGLWAHLSQRATIEPVAFATITAAIVGFGGWQYWSDEAPTVWAGSAPVLALGAYTLFVVLVSAVRKKIRWRPEQ